MIVLSKIVTALVLPPGLFVLGIFLCLVFRRRRAATGMLAGLAVLVYALSLGPVKDLLLLPLENRHPALSGSFTAPGGTDFVVVLGGGTVAGSPEEGGKDSLGGETMKRVVHGFLLASRFGLPLVFSGGRVFDRGQEPEAETAARFLAELGMERSRVLKEEESRNTWENARFGGKTYGAKRVILVTSAYHMPRSVWCFEKNGIAVFPAPVDYHADRGARLVAADFLPSMHALKESYLALHEYLGLLSYKAIHR